MVMEIGRVVVKIAGRDAGKKAAVVDILDNNYVLIDGETRRRKCNIAHLEPLDEKVDIKKGTSHEEAASALKKLGITARSTKPREKTERPRKQRKEKAKPEDASEKEKDGQKKSSRKKEKSEKAEKKEAKK